MATYKELKKQIAAIEAEATRVRKEELAAIIKSLKQNISEYELTPQDLFRPSVLAAVNPGVAAVKKPRAEARKKRVLPIKFRDPASGATWTGVGRAPLWIKNARNRDEFLVNKSGDGAAPAKKAVKPKAKAPARKAAPKPGTKAAAEA